MFSWIAKGRTPPGVVGIESRTDGLAVAHIHHAPDGPQLASCEFVPCPEQADRAALLRQHIDSLGLKNSRCNTVLPLDDYSLQLTEAPNVADDELRQAMRWQIKDSIPMALEEAVIDAFPLPADTGRSDMAYAVAAHRDRIDRDLALTTGAGLKLNAIDISELGLRNLSELFAEGERSLALLWIEPHRACLNLYRDGQLYLSRRVDIAWNGGLLDELPADTLTLELQRSLDYFERQMRQAPPRQIYLCGEHISADKIPAAMRDGLAAAVDVLPLAERLPLPPGVDQQTLGRCLGAIGAALRSEETAE